MSTTTEKTVADLVASIHGKNMLSGWDVLVCYHDDDLNKLLQTRHDTINKDAKISVIPQFPAKYKDPIRKGVMVDLYYDIVLGNPTMKFLSKRSSIQLRFPLSGTFGYEPAGDKEAIESGYFLNCITSLRTVEGSLTSGEKPVLKHPDEIVSFENGKTTECHVTIDMTNPEVSVVDSKGEKAVAMDAIVGSALFTHIRSVGLQYNLTGISSKTDGVSSNVNLVPSKFHMTTVSGAEGERAALLMWIAVEGQSFNGSPDTENTPLRFAPDSKTQISPIPKDKGASVYLSRDLVYSLWVKPGLKTLNCTDITLHESGSEAASKLAQPVSVDGMTITATLPSNQINVPRWAPDGNSSNETRVCEAWSFNMNQADFSLKLGKADSSLSITHKVKDVQMKSTRWITIRGMPEEKENKGKVDMGLKAECTGEWINTDNSEKVGIKYELPATFKLNPVNNDDPGWFGRAFGGRMAGTLKDMETISVPVPKLSFDFGSINYFLTTNLLFPGQHVYKSGKLPDELYLPRDLLIFGSIG